jgi:hypothetical protein
MSKQEDQKLLADLVKRAEVGEHVKIEYIRDWDTYSNHKVSYRATKMLVRSLKYSAKVLLKEYCRDIANGTADCTKLLVRNALLRTADFYKIEQDTILDMIYEYEAYLMDGNLLASYFGEIRPISECWDRRGMDC